MQKHDDVGFYIFADMYKIKINDKFGFSVDTNGISGVTTINGEEAGAEFLKIKENLYHIIIQNKSVTVEILSADYTNKNFRLRVNNTVYNVSASDKYDDLLRQMGFDDKASGRKDDIRAPMPGLVLDVKVNVGDQIQKGDPVVILEAMKMENILKAAAAGTVKKIAAEKGKKVEKNDLLVQME